MKITVIYFNSKGEAFEWSHQEGKPIDHTIDLLRKHFDAVRIVVEITYG